MALDGPTAAPKPERWTIRVEATPGIAQWSRRWSEQRQYTYHELVALVAYEAITAIQHNNLRKRRAPLAHPDLGRVCYFFRRCTIEDFTILITIYQIEFHETDPNPPPPNGGGHPMPAPIDPLTLDVSGSGKYYCIDYVEGVLVCPPIKKICIIQSSELGGIQPDYDVFESRGYFSPQLPSFLRKIDCEGELFRT